MNQPGTEIEYSAKDMNGGQRVASINRVNHSFKLMP